MYSALLTKVFALVALAAGASPVVFAPEACRKDTPRGEICWVNGRPPVKKTSCGKGVFIKGEVSDKKELENGCFEASQSQDAAR